MAITDLTAFVGEWELAVDLPGAEDGRGRVTFEIVGEMLVQRSSVPDPAPDSCCVILQGDDGSYIQHYFDSRGIARIYEMTLSGGEWVLERNKPDLTPLDFCQRYVGAFSEENSRIDGEWQASTDGKEWTRDFGITYTRIRTTG